MKTSTRTLTFLARHAGVCCLSNRSFEAGAEIAHVWNGYALVSELGAEATANVTSRAFFALYDSGRKVEAGRAYDALSPAARKMVDDEQVARCERACPQM